MNTSGQSGLQRLREGKFEQALPVLLSAVEESPEDGELHSALGVCLMRGGAWLQGLNALHKAVQLDPHSASARLNLARALYQVGELGPCRLEVDTVLARDPGHPVAAAFRQHLDITTQLPPSGLIFPPQPTQDQATCPPLTWARRLGRGLAWGLLYGQWGTLALAALLVLNGGDMNAQLLEGLLVTVVAGIGIFGLWGMLTGVLIALTGSGPQSGTATGLFAGLALWGISMATIGSGSLILLFLILGQHVGAALGRRVFAPL